MNSLKSALKRLRKSPKAISAVFGLSCMLFWLFSAAVLELDKKIDEGLSKTLAEVNSYDITLTRMLAASRIQEDFQEASLQGIAEILEYRGDRLKELKTLLGSQGASAIASSDHSGPVSSEILVSSEIAAYIRLVEQKNKAVKSYIGAAEKYRESRSQLPISRKELLQDIRRSELRKKSQMQAKIIAVYEHVKDLAGSADTQRKKSMLAILDRDREVLAGLAKSLRPDIHAFFRQLSDTISLDSSVSRLVLESLSVPSQAGYSRISEALYNSAAVQDGASTGRLLAPLAIFLIFCASAFFYLTLLYAKSAGRGIDSVADDKNECNEDEIHSESFEQMIDDASSAPGKSDAVESVAGIDNNTSLDVNEAALNLCHQIESPLDFLEKNVEALNPVLEEIHEAFDFFDDNYQPSSLPSNMSALIDSGTVSELPFIVAELKDGLRSAKQITENIQSLVHRDPVEYSWLDLNESIKKMLRIKASSLRAVNVRLKLSRQPAEVFANASEIEHVIDSLVSNAIDAICNEDLAMGYVDIGTVVSAKGVKLTVRDNGGGIASDVFSKIFEPFFTTKTNSSGAGMGLTLAKKHIERIGGKIDVVSRQGNGAIARVVFPVQSPVTKVDRISKDENSISPQKQTLAVLDKRSVSEVDLNIILKRALSRRRDEIRSVSKLRLKFSEMPAMLKCVPIDMTHMVNKLIDNALEAMQASKTIAGYIDIATEVKDSIIRLSVRDNASPVVYARTKSDRATFNKRDKLTQENLSAVVRMVENQNGIVDIACTAKGGALVRVTLPSDRDILDIDSNVARLFAEENQKLKALPSKPASNVISLTKSEPSKFIDDDDSCRYGDEGVVVSKDERWLTKL